MRVPEPEPEPGLRVAQHVACTEAEGPRRRFALWTRGCSLRCPGCCNPELFEPGDRPGLPVSTLVAALAESQTLHAIEGLTVLGGEPLEQLAGVTALARGARALGLGVIVFTGYRLDEARELPGFDGPDGLLATIDTLVHGRFDIHDREPSPAAGGRRWLGSRNQRLHHVRRRYAAPALWSPARGEPRATPDASCDAELQIHPDGTIAAVGSPRLTARLLRSLRASR